MRFKSFGPWVQGRQGTGYLKRLILELDTRLFGCDMYLIEYPPHGVIPPHRDPVTGRKHFRLNIVLTGQGEFRAERVIVQTQRIILFRPDEVIHSMRNGPNTRRILSIGLAF